MLAAEKNARRHAKHTLSVVDPPYKKANDGAFRGQSTLTYRKHSETTVHCVIHGFAAGNGRELFDELLADRALGRRRLVASKHDILSAVAADCVGALEVHRSAWFVLRRG